MDQNQQEIMYKLSMFEQQMQQIQQQLQAIEQGIVEMNTLHIGLEELKGSNGNEILASIGKGIYAKTKLISEELIVDVGGKNFVKKSIDDTKKIIEEQIKKLEGVKIELNSELEKLSGELTKTIIEAQNKEKK